MDDLLDAVAEDERRTFEAGIAAAVRDHPAGAWLDAVLHFMSNALSDDHLQQLVITEPEFVLERFVSILPALRTSLASLIDHEGGATSSPPSFAEDLADALIRLAMSHFLLAEGDASRFERSAAAIVATMPANSPRSAR